MAHKTKRQMKSTDSNRVYRITRKYYLAGYGDLNCTFCPYHAKENKDHKLQKSWKKFRKTRWKNP